MIPRACILGLCIASTAAAQSFDCVVLPASTVDQDLVLSTPLAGTFIGNYDATTNPTGTRTLPGLFGGSGNQPIPYTSTLRTTQALTSHPAGTFGLRLGPAAVCEVTSFSADLLNGTPGTVELELVMAYSSFHTVNPTSVYPSVGEVTIPMASGTVTEATATQAGPALGTAIESAAGSGSYQVSVVVPVLVHATAEVAGQSQKTEPTPAALTLTGTLTVQGSSATLTATAEEAAPIGPLPPPPPLENQPMAIPTVLPPGSTANILISGTFGETTGTLSIAFAITASGSAPANPADVDHDGDVDGSDLAIILSAWGTDSPKADVNGDGIVGGPDLTAVLGAWS